MPSPTSRSADNPVRRKRMLQCVTSNDDWSGDGLVAITPPPQAGVRCPSFRVRGGIKLLVLSLSSIGWRRGLGRGGPFLLLSPLLNPLPTRSSQGEEGEIDAAPFRVSAAVILLATALAATAQEKVTYDDQVTPILRNSCLKCHNADKAKADLDLSTFSAALKGGGSGKVLLPGDPDGSKLLKTILRTEEPFMPSNGPKLPDAEIEVVRKWIAGGLLEKATSQALASNKPKLVLKPGPNAQGKPEGPPVLPVNWLLDPSPRTEQTNVVTALAAGPWSPVIAVGGQHQLLTFDAASFQLLGVLPFPEGQPNCVRFSRDGRLLAIGGGRGAQMGFVDLHDVATGERLTRVGGEFDSVLAADLNSDLTEIALGGPGKRVKVFAVRDGQLLYDLKKHTDWITAIEYSPDSVLLATGDRNGGLVVWEADSGQELYTLNGHQAAITAVSWRGDSDVLLSASEDGSIRIWEMREGRQAATWTAHKDGVLDARFGHDGRIVSCGRDRQIGIWDGGGAKQRTWAAESDLPVRATFNHDGTRVFTSSWQGKVTAWNAADGKPAGEIPSNPPTLADRLEIATREAVNREAAAAKSLEAATAADAEVTRLKAAIAAFDRSSPAFQFLAATQLAQAAQRKAADEAARALESLKAAAAKSAVALANAEAETVKTQAALEKTEKFSEPYKQLTQQIEAANKRIALATTQAAEANQALASRKSASDAASSESAAKIKVAVQEQEKTGAPLPELNQKCNVAKEAVARAQTLTDQDKAAVATRTAAAEQTAAVLAAAETEAARLAKALAESDKNSPQGQELAKQAEDAAKRVATAQAAHETNRKALDDSKSALEKSTALLAAAEAEAAQLRKRIDPIQLALQQATDNVAQLESARVAATDKASQEIQGLQAAANQAASVLTAAKAEAADLQAKLEKTEKHSDAFKELTARLEVNAKQVASLRPPAEQDRKEVADLQAALERSLASVKASEAEAAKTMAALVRHDAGYLRFLELEKQSDGAVGNAATLRTAAETARKEAEAAQGIVARIRVDQAHAALHRARTSLASRQQEHEKHQAALTRAEEEHNRLTKDLATAQAKLADLAKQIEALSGQTNRVATQLSSATAAAAASSAQLASQKELVERLDADHKRLLAPSGTNQAEAKR